MIPLQITLQGFLSYREKTTISFEGASLWMLAGANGAGKSSVFDAMRWTLFGAHRGGKSGHEALIHRDLDRLRVAFDLALGEQRFRLIRTLARAGRSTWQIEEILGDEIIKVSETDSREGYEKWVRERIGISDETFTTAMYLAQNRGDAMLSANPAQRYEMLAEIVDISAYAALHERAKTDAAHREDLAKTAKNSWNNAPDADPENIEAFQIQLRELGGQIAQNSARREAILGLEPLAAQWQNWQNERAATQKKWENAQLLLADAPQIERDFARRSELQTLIPPLSRYASARVRAAQIGRELTALNAELEAARLQLEVSQTRFGASQLAFAALENARAEAETTRLSALAEKNELAPHLALALQIANYRAEIAALERELGAFAPGLTAQKSELESRIARAEEELAASAILRRFAREKLLYRVACDRENSGQTLIESLQGELPAVQLRAESGRKQHEIARQNAKRALEIASAATTRQEDAQAARARFESLENEADCFFCGQKLTPQHRQGERARLENALQNAQNEAKTAQSALENADLAAREAQADFEAARDAAQNAENALKAANHDQQNALETRQNALKTAQATFTELLDVWRENAARENAFFEALDGDFPDVTALVGTEVLAASIGVWRLELEQVNANQAQQLRVELRLGDRRNQLAPLLETAPEETLEALQVRDLAAQNVLDGAQERLKTGKKPLETARLATDTARNVVDAARALSTTLDGRRVGLRATQIERQRAVNEEENGPQSALLAVYLAREDSELSAILNELQRENSALSGGDLDARRERLRLAQSSVSQLEIEAAGLDKSLESVPRDARRAPQELRSEVADLKIALDGDIQLQAELLVEKNRLEGWRDAKIRLEKEHLESENRARQARTLADLLGPHQLQRFLLREAENGIVDEANAVLDRISSGGLRLELRADDEEIAGARKGIPKVLDLAIFRADEGGNSIESGADSSENVVGIGESGLENGAEKPQNSGEPEAETDQNAVATESAGGKGVRSRNKNGSSGIGIGNGRAAGMLPAFLSGSQRFRVSVALALGIGRYATRGGGSRLEAVIIDEGFGALDKIGRGEMIDELQMLGEELQRVILVSHQEEFFEAFPNRYLIENDGVSSTARLMAE